MAKEVKDRYVKLGEKAGSFSDPTSGLKVTGEPVKLERAHKNSNRVRTALKNGHLEYCSAPGEEDTDDENLDQDLDNGTTDPYTEEVLMKMKKAELRKLVTEMGSEETELDLDEYNKAELTEEILELQEAKE